MMPTYETVWPVLLRMGADGSISAERSSLDGSDFSNTSIVLAGR